MRIFIILITLLFFINNSYAQNNYYFEDKKELTQQEIKIWKYKMSRLSVRYENGKWEILQGINSRLTDIELLKLINSEDIGYKRLKNAENKQNLGNLLSITGLVIGLAGGFLLTSIFKFENSTIYGISGIAAGIALLFTGASLSPLIQDEEGHIISMEEAEFGISLYNKKLKENLGLKEADID